eukprot:TRINITY_DN5005_c0_g1_i1.p1 TRINITY_DN5005_c0_g1~~TRINITY_DN5005_c0_g1_i1.p1  ORF type:complete len:374 (-),score=94.41 TRINITY_DN5005_c0_g1_i1:28-1149(-)
MCIRDRASWVTHSMSSNTVEAAAAAYKHLRALIHQLQGKRASRLGAEQVSAGHTACVQLVVRYEQHAAHTQALFEELQQSLKAEGKQLDQLGALCKSASQTLMQDTCEVLREELEKLSSAQRNVLQQCAYFCRGQLSQAAGQRIREEVELGRPRLEDLLLRDIKRVSRDSEERSSAGKPKVDGEEEALRKKQLAARALEEAAKSHLVGLSGELYNAQRRVMSRGEGMADDKRGQQGFLCDELEHRVVEQQGVLKAAKIARLTADLELARHIEASTINERRRTSQKNRVNKLEAAITELCFREDPPKASPKPQAGTRRVSFDIPEEILVPVRETRESDGELYLSEEYGHSPTHSQEANEPRLSQGPCPIGAFRG